MRGRAARCGVIVLVFAVTAGCSCVPKVESTDPRDGETGVGTTRHISIMFSEAMDRESVEMAFRTDPPVSGAFLWSADDREVTFTPDSPLAPNTTYNVSLGTEAESEEGVPIDDMYEFSFTTGSG